MENEKLPFDISVNWIAFGESPPSLPCLMIAAPAEGCGGIPLYERDEREKLSGECLLPCSLSLSVRQGRRRIPK